MSPKRAPYPTLRLERKLQEAGAEVVCGIDEVGRGAWAGPLMVGAAILPVGRRVNGVRDSKLLTEAERERIFSERNLQNRNRPGNRHTDDRLVVFLALDAGGARISGLVRRDRAETTEQIQRHARWITVAAGGYTAD